MLSCKDLSLTKSKTLLAAISCTLTPHRLTVVLGPNGAGKSTLLRCFAGLEPSVYAFLHYESRSYETISRHERARLIAWCPELLSCGEGFTVEEVVLLGRFPWHQGLPSKRDRIIVDELLNDFKLSSLRKEQLFSLSSGELRKTMIARTLAQDTPLVLLDEPTANLDIGASVQLLQYLHERVRRGSTLCISMHDLVLAKQFAHEVVVMQAGTVLTRGSCQEIFAGGHLASLYGIDLKEIAL